MQQHNFGQTLKIQSAVATLNIRSRSSNLVNSFVCKQCINASLVQKTFTVSEDSSEKADLQFFKDGDRDNEVTLTRSKSSKSYQLLILPQ